MFYELKGGSYPVVVCHLADGESMVTERGAMAWQSPNVVMDTRAGGPARMAARAATRETILLNTFTAEGEGMVAFGSCFPGRIVPVEVAPGRGMVLQKNAFLAAEEGVKLGVYLTRRPGAGLFGGDGFVLQRLSGSGTAFAEIDGELVEYGLAAGEELLVNTGNVAGFEPTVTMAVRQVPGLKNKLFGGEGFFNTLLRGPGTVWIQTMPVQTVAAAVRPYLKAKSGGGQ